jgi:hypothetical protein
MITALLMVLVGQAMILSYLSLSANDSKLTHRAIEYQRAVTAAEAGLEYGILALREVIFLYHLSPTISRSSLQAQLDAIPQPPQLGEFQYRTPSGANGFRIRVETEVAEGTITNGTAARGCYGSAQVFSISCGALGTNSGVGAVLRQTVQAVGLCLIRFGVFYENDLEILPGTSMTFEGPVHANGDIYLGGPLTFYDRITSHNGIIHRRKDDNTRLGEAVIRNTSGTMRSMKLSSTSWLDSDSSSWMVDALNRWGGNVMSATHGVPKLSPPIQAGDSPHDIIERPLSSTNTAYNALTENEKFANKAGLKIYISSSGTLTAFDAHSNNVSSAFTPAVTASSGGLDLKNSDGTYVLATTGTYSVTHNAFYDSREGTQMRILNLYVDQITKVFSNLFTASASDGRGIIYASMTDPDGLTNGVKVGVRLRNGRAIEPFGGLTIASDLPVYIEGDYNSTNTRPALVAGDAVTMLSKNWQDSRSSGSETTRVASNTTYKTVLMTGNSETTWGSYNGGLENVMRFLEKWDGKTATYRGSIIDLWKSEYATGAWIYGTSGGVFRYTAPTRDWGYDTLYRTQSPPGMTYVFGMEELSWDHSTWSDEGW